jgi:small subunit ribosomal protein S15
MFSTKMNSWNIGTFAAGVFLYKNPLFSWSCVFSQYVLVYTDMLTTKKKQNIIKKVQLHKNDTGSPEVQIAILSKRIDELADHLKEHKKDNHSRRGLIKMVADRRTHLKFLEKTDKARHATQLKKMKV